MRILVINPNTTSSMTEKIAEAAQGVTAAGTEIVAATSSIGPPSIEGYFDEALAVPGVLLEIAKGQKAGVDAAIIACFDDTGLDAARAFADIPVIGICEAALATVSFLAERFTIVTTLERSRQPIEHLARRYGMEGRATVRAANIPVLSLEESGSAAGELLRGEIRQAIARDRAGAIVLGCAGMADLASALRVEFGIPIIDGVSASVKIAEGLVTQGHFTSKSGGYARPVSKSYAGFVGMFSGNF